MDLTAVGGSIDDFLAGRCGRPPAAGDVLAFSGASHVDRFIQKATLSKISHVGILIQPEGPQPAGAEASLSLLEATGLGVTVTPLEDALASYRLDHTCFYLPLADAPRASLLPAALSAYYAQNAANKYNYAGVAAAGLYDLENPLFHLLMEHVGHQFPVARIANWWTHLGERLWDEVFGLDPSYRRLFCSQLVTAALLAARILLPGPPNARLVVPVQVCRFDIYGGAYQLNGAALMADPFEWGAAPLLAEALAAAGEDEVRP
ncbi:MAG TPA: hypothetical protein VHM31_06995 [Polyangia bacterium]|nr:hypothetical protein [Polyangia bacterium]